MTTAAILYNSAGLPIGARAKVSFFRPPSAPDTTGTYPAGFTAPSVAAVVPFGSETSGTYLGDYIIEALGAELNGTKMDRRGMFEEAAGQPSLVREDPTLSLTAQMASAGVPTLCPGDYCNIFVGMQATSTGAALVPIPASRWFVGKDSISGSQVNKFGLSLHLDRTNSSPNLSQF